MQKTPVGIIPNYIICFNDFLGCRIRKRNNTERNENNFGLSTQWEVNIRSALIILILGMQERSARAYTSDKIKSLHTPV